MGAPIGPNDTADVVVVGAGLAGLAAAAVAAGPAGKGSSSNGSSPRRVVLVDARSDEHTLGGSGPHRPARRVRPQPGPPSPLPRRPGPGRAGPAGPGPPRRCAPDLVLVRLARRATSNDCPTTLVIWSPAACWAPARRAGGLAAGPARAHRRGRSWGTGAWPTGSPRSACVPTPRGWSPCSPGWPPTPRDLTQLSADAGVRQVQLAMIDGVDYLDGGWQQLVDGLLGRGPVPRGAAACRGPTGVGDRLGSRARLDARTGSGRPAAGRHGRAGPGVARCHPGRAGRPAGLDAGPRRHRRLPRPGPAPAARTRHRVRHRPARLPVHPHPVGPTGPRRPGRGARAALRRPRRELGTGPSCGSWPQLAGVEHGDVVVDRFLHRMVVAHAVPRPGSGLAGRPPVEVAGHPGDVRGRRLGGPRGDAGRRQPGQRRAGRDPRPLAHLGRRPQLAGSRPDVGRRAGTRHAGDGAPSRPSGHGCWAWPTA